jgi:hypothetical protein
MHLLTLGGFTFLTHARGLRLFDPRSGASPFRPTLGGFALSTHARGLCLFDLRSGALPFRPTLGGFALLTYARGLRPSTYARGLRPPTCARGLRPPTYVRGLRLFDPHPGAPPFDLHDSSKFARSALKSFPRCIHTQEINKTQIFSQISAPRCPDSPSDDHFQ